MSISLDCRDGNCAACETCCHHCHPLMLWAPEPRREHLLAALGVVVGMLVIALSVIALIVISASSAHAHDATAPAGAWSELVGTLAYLGAMSVLTLGALIVRGVIHDHQRARKGRR